MGGVPLSGSFNSLITIDIIIINNVGDIVIINNSIISINNSTAVQHSRWTQFSTTNDFGHFLFTRHAFHYRADLTCPHHFPLANQNE